MGIKGFHRLGEKDKLYGPSVPIRGKLIVDGYTVLHELYSTYKLEWATGGCYADQAKVTRDYYGTLVGGGVEPIVVLDGGGQKNNIHDTIHRRYRDINDLCGTIRKQHENSDKEYGSHRLPILARHVYLSTLKQIDGVKVYVADGKALEMVVQLANSHRCPILTNNSNFCVSGVKGGIIFTRDLDRSSVTAPIFEQSKLVSLLNLPNPDLLFAIVAIMGDGSDTTVPFLYHGGIKVDIERVCKERGIEKTCKEQGIEFKDRPWFYNVVDYLNVHGCESFQGFMTKIDSFNFRCGQKGKLTKNCRNVLETYSIQETSINEDCIIEDTTLRCHASHDSFRQVVRQHREGNFPVLMMDAVCVGQCVLDSDVGDPAQPPVPFMGQHVRKIMYGLATPFMSRSSRDCIDEYCRSEQQKSAEKPWEYVAIKAQPLWRYKDLSIDVIFDMEPAKRETTAREAIMDVLRVPDGVQEKFHKKIDNVYLLGIYITHYWAYHLYRSHSANHLKQLIDQLIEALVLNFLLCPQREDYSHDQNYFNPMWIKVYHALLEWQCLYKDVCGLNQMLLSPFKELPLTNILNGSFIIELALSEADSLTSHLDKLDPHKRDLYDRTVPILHDINSSC